MGTIILSLNSSKLWPSIGWNTLDLGDSTNMFKDFYLAGVSYYRDTEISITSATDGHLDVEADTSIDLIIDGTEQVLLTDGALSPTTTDDVDLGTTSLFYKNAYVQDLYLDDTSTYLDNNSGDIDIYTVANKTIELQQPVYKDINLGASVLSLPVATQPDEVEIVDENGDNTGIYTWGFAENELVSGVFELQHDYQEGTNLTFHVHWGGNDAPTGTDYVNWELVYTVAQNNQTLNPAATISVETEYDTQYEWKFNSFSQVTGSAFTIGDQFFFRLKRIAAVGDAYAGDAVVATIGVHYQVNTLGSRQIGTK